MCKHNRKILANPLQIIGEKMIKNSDKNQIELNFYLPFGGKLNPGNRWVKLANIIPWNEIQTVYESSLSHKNGSPSIPSRVAVGALIIKHIDNLTDEDTIEHICENPYYQYFLGYHSFRDKPIFTPSLFVAIRNRLGLENIQKITETLLKEKSQEDKEEKDNDDNRKNGMLIIDATVAPADIAYPTDTNLLNKAREISENLIDLLWALDKQGVKPRTYRRRARKEYIGFTRNRRKSKRKIRKINRKQICYVERNIKTINKMLGDNITPFPLPYSNQKKLWIITEFCRQQREMYDEKKHKVEGRIVSLQQPHIRPIQRGKAGKKTEFGAKINASYVNGLLLIDHLSWNNFNESKDLKFQVENYKQRYGYYPESVNADKIYWTRENRAYCKLMEIKLYGGSPLGRPPKTEKTSAEKRKIKKEAGKRNRIEGIFGNSKRRFGLDLVMAKTARTSENWIAMIIFVMNMVKMAEDNFLPIFFHAVSRAILLNSIVFDKLQDVWSTCFPIPYDLNIKHHMKFSF